MDILTTESIAKQIMSSHIQSYKYVLITFKTKP